MKNRLLLALFALGCLGSIATAQAQVGLSADVGTLGVGLHAAVPIRQSLNARLGVNFGNYSYNTSTANLNYDMDLKLRTFEALLDYYPTGSGFRLSGGLLYNGNKIDADGRPRQSTYTFNGNTYSTASAGNVNGSIDFRSVAPYLGIGWSSATKESGWSFTGDVGAMYQGSPRTALTSTGCTASAALCAQLNNDLAVENRVLSDKVDNYKLYPVIRAGLQYRF